MEREIFLPTEHDEDASPFLDLPRPELHQDFPRYYHETIQDPKDSKQAGTALQLIDHVLRLDSFDPQAITPLAQFPIAKHDGKGADRPRIYRESLAHAVVDLTQEIGITTEVITALDLERVNQRVIWRNTNTDSDPELSSELQEIDLPEMFAERFSRPQETAIYQKNEKKANTLPHPDLRMAFTVTSGDDTDMTNIFLLPLSKQR